MTFVTGAAVTGASNGVCGRECEPIFTPVF